MERQLLILVLLVGSVWLVFDQFFGKKRLSLFVSGLMGGNNADVPVVNPTLGNAPTYKA